MKKIKGFTLIELIVAMAIFGILMAGIIRMVQPISENAASAKIINDQKNVENAINRYIGENMRLATNLYIVKGGTPSNAVDKFIAASPVDKYGKPFQTADKSKIHVICFDGTSQYKFSKYSQNYGGRIIRTIDGKAAPAAAFSYSNCKADGSGDYYMALGRDYYQQGDYYLTVDMSSNMLGLKVYSDYYKSATAKKPGSTAYSSSSNNQVEGVYEMKAYGSKPMDGASNFVFDIVNSSGTQIATKTTSVSPTSSDPIYFVFTTEDLIATP